MSVCSRGGNSEISAGVSLIPYSGPQHAFLPLLRSSIKARWNKTLLILLSPVQTVQFCFQVLLYFLVWGRQTTIPYLCIHM